MFIYFQIIILLLVSLALCTLLKNRLVVFLSSIILGLFITLQLVSKNMGGNLIDYKFYEHINLKDIWSLKDFFLTEILIFTFIFVLICALLYNLSQRLRDTKISKRIVGLVIGIGVVLLFLPNGVLNNIYGIVNIKTAKVKSFDNALEDLGIAPSTYITSDKITATPGKNIIVLSLESLERGFLEAPLEKLTPNLRKLANENTYITMEQSQGSTWTSASMYTALTGLPSFFKSSSNEIFQGAVSYKASNLGDVLKSAGYNMSYLMTRKDFSGMGNLLNTFNFDVKSEVDFETPYKESHWGIHDKDLFDEAKKEISLQANKDEPFALFLSTISGHFPNGVYDKRMEGVLPKQDTNLEFMTAAVDFYVGQLIEHLKKENLLQDTVIYIFPDHELMGDTSPVLKKFKKERALYVITNADANQIKENLHEPITQIDLPRIIINGSGIKTNATFLTDYIKNKNKEKFIRKNKKSLLSLNESSLERLNYDEGFRLTINEQGLVEIASETSNLKNSIPDIRENTLYTINFRNDMSYILTREVLHDEKGSFTADRYHESEIKAAFESKDNPTLTFSVHGDSIYGYFQKGELVGIARSGEKEIAISKNDLAFSKQWKAIQTGKHLKPNKIFLKSTGYKFIRNHGHSRIFTGYKPYVITRGLNLLYIENDKYTVKNFDTFGKADDAKAFMKLLRQLLNTNTDFVIVAHDSAAAKLKDYEIELSALGFDVLSDLQKREAYIGYAKDGVLHEQKDEKSITLELDLEKLPENPETEARKKDTLRFIAHAGGGINGDTYTNSLEALNLNYKKGFRLFEMDIIKTADNVYVSAHDWDQWTKKTKYKGELPPTKKVFLETPIKNYTPMDIGAINLWFKNHPDAILVTDKVNSPKEFASAFIDKNRLMMELFNKEAILEGKAVGIQPIVSESVLRGLRGKELETLQEWGVDYIAISRKIILKNLPMLKKLKEAGIKTYVFTVHHNSLRDETFVVENEMDYIYGMYADEWDFRE